MSPTRRPPCLATMLLALASSRRERAFLLGDLEEEFHALREARGQGAADAWYWSQVLRSLGPLVLARARALWTARSVAAIAIGVTTAVGTALVLAQGLRFLVGPCEGLPLPAIAIGVAGIALVSSASAGCASRWVAGGCDLAALAIIGLVVVAPEAIHTIEVGASAPLHFVPLIVTVLSTGLGLAISAWLRADALGRMVPGGPA